MAEPRAGVELVARWHSYQLSQGGAGQQRQFAGFRDGGTLAEHGISLALDSVQNLPPATAEQFDIDGEGAVHLFNQRQTLPEPFPGTFHFEAHQIGRASCRERVEISVVGEQLKRKKMVRSKQ